MDEGWQPLQLPPESFDDETSHQLIFDVNIPEIRVFGLWTKTLSIKRIASWDVLNQLTLQIQPPNSPVHVLFAWSFDIQWTMDPVTSSRYPFRT